MKLTNKQINTLHRKFGKELTGEQAYWVYSTWGVKRGELLALGFKVIEMSSYATALQNHTQDSNVLNFKFWKEGIAEEGLLTPKELIEEGTLTKKKAINLMFKICKEYHGNWPKLISREHYFIRWSSIDWFYKNKKPSQIVCQACKEMGFEK